MIDLGVATRGICARRRAADAVRGVPGGLGV